MSSKRFAYPILRRIDIEILNPRFERIHRAIEVEIKQGLRRLEIAGKEGNDEMLDSLIDDECDEVEELLGIGFVAGQSFINRIRSRVTLLDRYCVAEFGEQLGFLVPPGSLDGLLSYGEKLHKTQLSVATIVNGVANYWKHSDEWTTCETKKDNRLIQVWDISQMNYLQKRTAQMVSAIGLCPGSTGNLRHAAKTLGINKYQNLHPMRIELTLWAKHVYQMASDDLETLISRGGKLEKRRELDTQSRGG